jgi:AAA domain
MINYQEGSIMPKLDGCANGAGNSLEEALRLIKEVYEEYGDTNELGNQLAQLRNELGLPQDVWRELRRQAKSEWESSRESAGRSKAATPKIVSLSEFRAQAKAKPKRKIIIEGVLKKQSKAILSSASKLGKTWVTIDLALTVSKGGSWLGFKCNQGRVLYVNFELQEDTMDERFDIMFNELCEDENDFPNLDIIQLRGYSADASTIANLLIKECDGKDYDLVIIDPLYKMLGDLDENSAEAMNKLMNEIERIAQNTGAAIYDRFALHKRQ